jgi:hypothetical protein
MLAIIGVILILLWALGFFAHVAGGFIHLLLLIALVMFVLHLMRGSKPV